MIGLALLLLQVGAGAGSSPPLVGDTIWITRTVPVTPRQTVRPAEWKPADPVELVGPPRVTMHGMMVEIQYPLTVWRTGRHRIEIPGPLILKPDGSADSLPPQVITLNIASVLPAVPIDSPIAPQPRVPVVPRREVSLVPLLVLWGVVIVVSVLLRWWWRRRGTPMPLSPTHETRTPAVPVERWAETGERRAVASLAATRLRTAVGRRPKLDPEVDAEVHALLGALDRARFGSAVGEDVLTLCRRAAALEDRLGRESVRESVAAPVAP